MKEQKKQRMKLFPWHPEQSLIYKRGFDHAGFLSAILTLKFGQEVNIR